MAAEVASKVSEILGDALCKRMGSVILDYIVSTSNLWQRKLSPHFEPWLIYLGDKY